MADTTARTERATPRRREEARRDGLVAMSPEVAPVAVMLVVLAVATQGAPLLLDRSRVALASWLAAAGPTAAADGPVTPLLARATLDLGWVLGALFVAVAAVGIGAVAAQVGWHPNPAALMPDPRRIAPATGWRRIASLEGAGNLVKAVAKVALVLVVGQQVLWAFLEGALAAPAMPVESILALAGTGLRDLFVVMALALAVLAAADYGWARWRHEQRLRMTRPELREELRQTEGDPQVRQRFRRAHRETAGRSTLDEVRRADVVVASPQFAVAIRYRSDETSAPKILAKGAGSLAESIIRAARAAGIPLVERRALARTLFRSTRSGSEIPPPLYPAVSEVLAHLYATRSQPVGEESR